jgi:hypothetical protein
MTGARRRAVDDDVLVPEDLVGGIGVGRGDQLGACDWIDGRIGREGCALEPEDACCPRLGQGPYGRPTALVLAR